MKKIFWVCVITVGIVSSWLLGSAISKEQIPVPEFYGLYVVSHGKENALKNASEENRIQVIPMETLPMGTLGAPLAPSLYGIKVRSGINVSPNCYFLSYGKDFQAGLKLGKLRFDKSKRAWLFDKNIQVKIGPVKGQSELVRILPSSPLEDGVYILYKGDYGFSRQTDASTLHGEIKNIVVYDVLVGKAEAVELEESSGPDWLIGTWQGARYQDTFTWPEMRLVATLNSYKFEYASCIGYWSLNYADTKTASFTQHVTSKQDITCKDNATVTVTKLSENQLKCSWSSSAGSSPTYKDGNATLKKLNSRTY